MTDLRKKKSGEYVIGCKSPTVPARRGRSPSCAKALKFCRREQPFNQSLAQQPQSCAPVPFAAKRSHFHVHPGDLSSGARAEHRWGSNIIFGQTRNTAEYDRPAGTQVEGEICEFVSRDVVTSLGRQPENESELVASNINSMLQRATATAVQEIDRLITELEASRDKLHNEGVRVQREIVQYATFTQAALQSTKIIAESLMQWKKVPTAPTRSD